MTNDTSVEVIAVGAKVNAAGSEVNAAGAKVNVGEQAGSVPHPTPSSPPSEQEESLEVRKRRLIAEIQQDSELYEQPQKPLDDALLEERRSEKEALEALVRENVAVSRARHKLEAQLLETAALNEVLRVEVDVQKQAYRQLEASNKALQDNIRELIRQQGQERALSGATGPEQQDSNNNVDEEPSSRVLQKRVRELQFRMLRMATDLKEKDMEVEALQTQNEELRALVEELERALEPAKVSHIRQKLLHTEQPQHTDTRANLVKQTVGPTDSRVCVII